MKLDVVICTYNRPAMVNSLVQAIKAISTGISEIIIVDSSDSSNSILQADPKINYIKSDRKSQPYQRYLGTLASKSEIIVFFDDDVKIIDDSIFNVIKTAFQKNSEIAGVSAGIYYESGVEINQSKKSIILPNTGKISWLGKTTGLPNEDAFVDYFPGPIMAFRKSIVNHLFDEYMFSIFEKRIAMGEDKVISMRASKYGKLFYLGSKTYIHHPPEKSTYFINKVDFIAKTTFSRLWLSKQYAYAHNKQIWKAYLIFSMYLLKQFIFGLRDNAKIKGNFLAVKWLLQK